MEEWNDGRLETRPARSLPGKYFSGTDNTDDTDIVKLYIFIAGGGGEYTMNVWSAKMQFWPFLSKLCSQVEKLYFYVKTSFRQVEKLYFCVKTSFRHSGSDCVANLKFYPLRVGFKF